MDDAERRRLVEALHDTTMMLVVAVAGGGNAIITDLLDVPGASRTVLEARVPYAQSALTDMVGEEAMAGAGAVSDAMAEAMATACLERAMSLAPTHEGLLLGVGITAALVSDRTKRGDHRAHIAIAASSEIVRHQFVGLAKGDLDRLGEDRVVADAALEAIAAACGPDHRRTWARPNS
ncbi:MAG: hypothetical protein GY724_25425 [Actinomycetia bacterium]|nr:hypothetical protein [Actinomycetes bacterium]MCP4225814.1 hypothetical protein [Actinomycetes bacterium]MCP5034090.1 hypothetical protein [Actinomycetes bacterium]